MIENEIKDQKKEEKNQERLVNYTKKAMKIDEEAKIIN